jgi:AraC-like DNA-binding protein
LTLSRLHLRLEEAEHVVGLQDITTRRRRDWWVFFLLSLRFMPDCRVGGHVLDTPTGLRSQLVATSYLLFDVRSGASHVHLPSDLFFVVVDLAFREDSHVTGPSSGLWLTVFGVQAHASTIRSPAGRWRVAVASLTPKGMFAAFGSRGAVAFSSGQPQPLEALCDRDVAIELRTLLGSKRAIAQRAHIFSRWLEHRILMSPPLPPPAARVGQAAAWLMRQKGSTLDMSALAQSVRTSLRQLERDFQAWLGLSPTTYARIVRFQRAAAAVTDGLPLSHAAADHGFVDQPHMTRSMRRLAQVTPLEMAREGARPGRRCMRLGLGGRVFLFDVAPTREAADPGHDR